MIRSAWARRNISTTAVCTPWTEFRTTASVCEEEEEEEEVEDAEDDDGRMSLLLLTSGDSGDEMSRVSPSSSLIPERTGDETGGVDWKVLSRTKSWSPRTSWK